MRPFHTVEIGIVSIFSIICFCTAHAVAGNTEIVYKPEYDSNMQMIISYLPVPKSWNLNKITAPDQPSIVGPQDVKVYDFNSRIFNFSSNPQTIRFYQSKGMEIRKPLTAEAIIDQDIAPLARQEGAKHIRQYRLPKLAQKNLAFMNQLYTWYPTQTSVDVLASEWRGKDGIRSIMILTYYQYFIPSSGMLSWHYQGKALEAPENQFDVAKKIFIEALLNRRYNPNYIQTYNRTEQQKHAAHRQNMRNQQAAHQQRMRNNQAAFEATQRTIRESNDAVNRSMMQSWRNRQESMDRTQQRTVNSIRDEETVYNSGTGQNYQVESGADQYWMNNDGEYIPSNDQFYNPNTDPNLNDQEWNEAEIQR